jgi:hypothetical protein
MRMLTVAVVVSGLLAMHGFTSGHALTATASMSGAMLALHSPATASMSSDPTSGHPAVAIPNAAHAMASMGMCVALPVLFLALFGSAVPVTRRRRLPELTASIPRRRYGIGRDPPTPPPSTFGVCLT